jgi:hypothetical protein
MSVAMYMDTLSINCMGAVKLLFSVTLVVPKHQGHWPDSLPCNLLLPDLISQSAILSIHDVEHNTL